VTDPRGTAADPRRDVARLRAALTALPAVREKLLTDPEQELRLRLAQALEAAGDPAAATTAALDALELMTDRAVDLRDPRTDRQRPATAAHAVLARTLGIERPRQAVPHAQGAGPHPRHRAPPAGGAPRPGGPRCDARDRGPAAADRTDHLPAA